MGRAGQPAAHGGDRGHDCGGGGLKLMWILNFVGRAPRPAADAPAGLDWRAGTSRLYAKPVRGLAFACVFVYLLTGCGYHVAGKANLVPVEVRTIAVVPWGNVSIQYKLSDYLAEAVSR